MKYFGPLMALAGLDRNFARIVFRQGRIRPGHAIEATVKSIPYWNRRDWGFVAMGLSEQTFVRHLNFVRITGRVL